MTTALNVSTSDGLRFDSTDIDLKHVEQGDINIYIYIYYILIHS